MKQRAPELSALIIIFRSTGPVISTRRSCKSGGAGSTRQSASRSSRVSGRKSGSSPAEIRSCLSTRAKSSCSRRGLKRRWRSATNSSASPVRISSARPSRGARSSTPSTTSNRLVPVVVAFARLRARALCDLGGAQIGEEAREPRRVLALLGFSLQCRYGLHWSHGKALASIDRMISVDLRDQYYLYVLLAQIAAFVEVARRQSVSRAAEALFVTQPALTARLQRLEADLGASLFVRTSRGMKLTDAGEAFLPYAVRALDALGDGRMQVNALERGGAGHLAIGAAPALSTYVLPGLLKRFAQSHPRVSVSVRTGHSEEILELVLREQVDIGLVRALHHRDIVSIPLYEDRLILVVDPAHPFAASGVMELDNIDAAKKMVEQGFGVALLPRTSVAQELSSGTLAGVAIQDASPVRRQIVAIRRRDAGRPTGAVAALLDTFAAGRAELTERPPPRAEAPRRAKAPGGRSRAPGPARRR